SSDDFDHVLQVIGFEISRFLDFQHISVAVLEPTKRSYRLVASATSYPDADGLVTEEVADLFPLPGSAMEHVAEARRPLVRSDLAEEPAEDEDRFPEERRLASEGMASCALVPMIGRDGVVGVLVLGSREGFDLRGDNLSFLELIAEQLTSALDRQKHLQQLRKRHGKLAIINEIGRKAMAQFDMIDVLDSVASSIQRFFGYYDVSIFLVDDSVGDVVLMAQAGAYRELTTVGYRQKIGVGLVGTCAATGETVLANDVTNEPRRVIAFPGEATMGAELCVAIRAGDNVMGVINVECKEVGAFDEEDVNALETFAGQIAQTIDNARLYEETRVLKEFNESIIASMPAALVVVDTDLRVQIVNETFCRLRGRGRDALIGDDIGELFTPWLLREGGLVEAIRTALDNGAAVNIPNVKGVVPPSVDRLFNLHVSSIGMGTQQCAMVLLEDVTRAVEHAYQLSMLRQINEAVQTTLDLKRLLRLVLTCATSGHALRFDRAILLMVDEETSSLEGRLAVGPEDREEAHRITEEMGEDRRTFKELLRDADNGRPDEEMSLYHIAARLKFPLDSDELVVRCVREKRVEHVTDARADDRVSESFRSIIGSDSFVVVPLIAKDQAVGAIIVDNLYTDAPITSDKIELLTIFANHAGLAVENAEAYDALHRQMAKLQDAYRELREAQGKLVQSEKLAAVGEVAAHVAHEIRNPLVTIGGFARSMRRQLGDEHPCTGSVDIVIEEVKRLEKILANVMDFSKPSAPWKRPTRLNQIIDNTCVLLADEFEAAGAELVKELDPDLPLVMVDAEQVKQALLNIVKNAVESLGPDGGRVSVTSRLEGDTVWIDVSDTGKGIAEDTIPNLFDPFFTTRPDGTGLGLAVTKKVIVDHGGDIEVKSKLGVGTTFTLSLPADIPARSRRRKAAPDSKQHQNPPPAERGGAAQEEGTHE
ncbi:MAG: GAF domain-containing protein, partial [Planctomycetota bacterium]